MKKNDFLRQVVAYDYPRNDREKDNFSIKKEYRELVRDVIAELRKIMPLSPEEDEPKTEIANAAAPA